ncbi:MAG: hypothetical protein H0X45_17085 [Planctomycetes bacterium]|nr:hypothetical protein [Planctomycetota bacterium]
MPTPGSRRDPRPLADEPLADDDDANDVIEDDDEATSELEAEAVEEDLPGSDQQG